MGVIADEGEIGTRRRPCERCGKWAEIAGDGPVVCGLCRAAAGETREQVCAHCGADFVTTADPEKHFCAVCWGDERTRALAAKEEARREAEISSKDLWKGVQRVTIWCFGAAAAIGILMGVCYLVGLTLARA